MNSPALLLALAPTATAVASRTVAAAKSAGESFASMLGNMIDAPAKSAAASPEAKPTLGETVQSLAEQLRRWLSEQGAGSDYSIDYHLTADGQSRLDVHGDSADQVNQLLASDPGWAAKLQQLASTLQAQSAQLNRDYMASSVTIAIDQYGAKAY